MVFAMVTDCCMESDCRYDFLVVPQSLLGSSLVEVV